MHTAAPYTVKQEKVNRRIAFFSSTGLKIQTWMSNLHITDEDVFLNTGQRQDTYNLYHINIHTHTKSFKNKNCAQRQTQIQTIPSKKKEKKKKNFSTEMMLKCCNCMQISRTVVHLHLLLPVCRNFVISLNCSLTKRLHDHTELLTL